MKLHIKLIISLLVCLVLVVSAGQYVQYQRTVDSLTEWNKENLKVLTEQEHQNAENIHKSVTYSVSGSLERGEMEKFTEILKQQRNVEGLVEFSLFDRDGKVSHSVDEKNIGRRLPPDVASSIERSLDRIHRQDESGIHVWQPQTVDEKCVRCHKSWKVGESGGATYFHFSTEKLNQAVDKGNSVLAKVEQQTFTLAVITLFAIVIVVVIVMGQSINVFVTRPLRKFSNILAQFESSSGDLTNRIDIHTKDEIGLLAGLFNSFIEKLHGLIVQAQESSTVMTEGTQEWGATVEEASSAVEEISSMTEVNADNAEAANKLQNEFRTEVEKANTAMSSLTEAMTTLDKASAETAAIISTIDAIAFQTNLLALNAAVEAARAGDSGAGFAVVANEVRNLAGRSSEAARNSSRMIENTLEQIKRSAEIVSHTEKAVGEVNLRSIKASELISDIAASSKEQARGIQLVSQAISNMDKGTREKVEHAESLRSTMASIRTDYTKDEE